MKGGGRLYHGHVVFTSTFFLSVVSIGIFNAASLFLDPLRRSFADDPLALGLLPFWITVQVVGGLAASMGGGPVQDWLSDVAGMDMPVQFAVLGGGAICAGYWMSSVAGSIWPLLTGAVCIGIGIGFYGFISAGILVLWFEENRGTMLLLALSGRGLGSMAGSLLISRLLERFEDGHGDDAWRPAMRIVGLLCLVIGAIASMGMRLPFLGEVEDHEAGSESGSRSRGMFDDFSFADDPAGDDDEAVRLLSNWDGPPEREEYGSVANVSAGPSPKASPHIWGRNSMLLHNASSRERSAESVLTQIRSARHLSERQKRMARRSIVARRLSVSRRCSLATVAQKTMSNRRLGSRMRPRRMDTAPGTLGASNAAARQGSSVSEFAALATAPIDFRASPEDDACGLDVGGEGGTSFRDILFSRTSVLLNLWSVVTSFSYLNLQVYVPGYVTNVLGLPSSVGGAAMTAFGLGLLLANLTLGPLTDRMGAKPMLFYSMTGLAVMDYLWPLCRGAAAMEVVAGTYGYLTATNGTLPLIIVADAFRDAPPNFILMLNGVLNVTKCPGFLFGPAAAAAFRRYPDDYGSIATASWIALVIGNAFLLGIPSPVDDAEGGDGDGGEEVDGPGKLKLSAVVETEGRESLRESTMTYGEE